MKLGNARGTIFLTTMVCVFMMSLSAAGIYQSASSNSHYMNRMQKSVQAQLVAEAGLARALSNVYSNWGNISSSFSSITIGGGTASTAVTTSGSRYLIRTTGTVLSVSRQVSAEVVGPATTALNYMFAAGGNASLDCGTGQSSGTITGDIYAGGNTTLGGPSGGGTLNITGDVYALGNISSDASVAVSGSSNASYGSSQSFPTFDYSHYQTIATANSTYTDGNVTYNSGGIPANPAGGVIYVNGNITIRGNQSTTACLIATGNITIEKSGSTYPDVTVNQFSNYPAIMTQGNLTFSSTGNGGAGLSVTGLVYSEGNITLSTGNHSDFNFTGAVVARGNISTGLTAWNTLNATYVAQTPPGMSGSATMSVVSYNE